MITSFKHKGLKNYFINDDKRLLNHQFIERIERILDMLDVSKEASDMNIQSWHFHSLKGERKGTYAVTVQGNWRITFKFKNGEAFDVDLEDYH